MLRLKERCEMGSFGGSLEEVHKIRDEQITKVEKFQRAEFRNARACFLSITELETVWTEIPKMILDQCLCVFDARKEWVFYEKTTKSSDHRKQKRYMFSENFKEFLVAEDSAEEEYKFHMPQDMFEMDDDERSLLQKKTCLGRWAAEAQVAGHGFTHPSFIPANFILFSEDEFAVMFLDLLDVTAVYHRIS